MAEPHTRTSSPLANFDVTRGVVPIIIVLGLLASALSFGFWMGGTLQGIERQQLTTSAQLTEIKESLEKSQKDLTTEYRLLEIRVRSLETEVGVQSRMMGGREP